MINASLKKLGSLVALIFSIHIEFLNLLFLNLLDKFITILLALSETSKTLFLSVLNIFKAKFDDLVAFNSNVSNTTILLKP